MAKDELPSINDILGDSNLPSYKDFLEKKEELPSVKEYFPESNQDFIEEETQTIEDVNGESFLEVTDVIQTPEWSELVRLVNDVRKDIPKIPEIKYYDEQLDEICSKISEIEKDYAKSDKIDTLSTQNEEFEGKLSDIKEEINNLPEVKYYEEDLKVLKLRIEQVKEAIPTFPDWIQEVHEVPDFSWIGKSFSIIDDDFSKVQGHLDLMKEKIDRTVNQINEDYDIRKFELKVDLKNINDNFDQTNDRITETKDKIYKELKDSSIRIWELHNTFKDDDRKLKKHLTSEQNKLKQSLEKEIEKINEQSIKADESILEFFNDLKETVDALPNTLPEVKYYDKDISSLRSDISSLKKGIKELNKISSSIKKDQKKLEENYLLNEPSDTKQEVEGITDPLTPLDQKFATLDDLSNHYKLFINRINTQLSTLGGGGAVNIKDMDDVQFDRTTGEGKLLIYDQTKSKWVGIASTALSGGSNATGLTGSPDITVTNITATGNVSIAGTLTYEDVTNVDSLGVGTFRNGIVVNTGTATTALLVEGDARITGILSVGQGTITLDPSSDEIKIGDTKLKRNSSSGAIEIRDKHNALKSIKMSKIQSDHVVEDDQGNLSVTGIVTATNIVSVKSDDGTSGRVDLYCESNNAHYARLQAPDHGDFSGNPTIKLPSSSGTLLLNNGSGANLTSLTGASAATYGDSGSTPVIVVDANGRITGISTASISSGGSYTDSDVDTHLNVSGASSGQILSWNGSDYAWVADQTGGGGTTQNLFETIAVSGQSDIVADSATDTLTLVAGSNMTITTNASGDSITFSSSGGGGGGGGVTTGKAIAMAMVFG
tara:strand:- start:4712 stop:7201 length:2490 start_codon:yes stop_codon:yes gene_type:complete